MKIRIRNGNRNFAFILPTGLVFGKWVVRLANGAGRRFAPEAMACISPKALDALFAEFRRIKKKHGTWELVKIESRDGSQVNITL